jgi:hypothetical protein
VSDSPLTAITSPLINLGAKAQEIVTAFLRIDR